MDPATGLTVLGAAIGSAKVVEKVLGPTAEYMGEGLRGRTERRSANAASVMRRVLRRLGDAVNVPGGIHPRVFLPAIAHASMTENPLVQEYFAGVIASSRTPDPDDDAGRYFV